MTDRTTERAPVEDLDLEERVKLLERRLAQMEANAQGAAAALLTTVALGEVRA